MKILHYILGIKIKSLLLTIVVFIPIALVGVFLSNCYKDNSDFIITLAKPMRDDMITIYNERKDFLDSANIASFSDTKRLLKKHGCLDIKQTYQYSLDPLYYADFSCIYRGKEMRIEVKMDSSRRSYASYRLVISRYNTSYNLFQSKDGSIDPIGRGYQSPCFIKKWGH